MSSDLIEALLALEKEKGIKKEVLIEALEAALISAYKRNFNQAQNVRVISMRQQEPLKSSRKKKLPRKSKTRVYRSL